MHFRQKLHEAYEAGYRSVLKEQAPPFGSWDSIIQYMEVQIAQGGAGQPQDDYALSMYDYDGDGIITGRDITIAMALSRMFPDAPAGADVYDQGFMYLINRPRDPRLGTDAPDLSIISSRRPKPGGSGMQGPYGPGGGRPFGPGGQGE